MTNPTYNVVLNKFRQFADGHYLVHQYSSGEPQMIDPDKEGSYPLMHVVGIQSSGSRGELGRSFIVYFFDVFREKENKAENLAEVVSDCEQLALDLIAEINNGQLFTQGISVQEGWTISHVRHATANNLAGVQLDLTVVADWDFDACSIPATYSPRTGESSYAPGTGNREVIYYPALENFPASGIQQVLYGDRATRLLYEWSGTEYVAWGAGGGGSLTLGETSSTAYRGDRGKTAYDHSQITAGNPHGTTAAQVGADPAGTAAGLIATEAATRAAADTSLATDIAAEATVRASADSTLSAAITQEVTDRQAAITSEASARAGADTTLQTNIAAEASARAAADTLLQTNIDAKIYLREIQVVSANPPSNSTRYFGSLGQAMSATAALRRIYTRRACTITAVDLTAVTGVASSNEDIAFYIRVNNAVDHTITLTGKLSAGANSYNRILNGSMNVALNAEDYFEIKMITPVLVTVPTGVIFTGSIEMR